MKHLVILATALLFLCPSLIAKKKIDPAPKESGGINWLSMDELQVKMKEKPKRVYMDMYTDWCGWCKKMDASTFSNPDVVRYMNENFYCVHFNAERKDEFRFMGQSYSFDPEKKCNTLAYQLMQGKLSYPTSIIMEPLYQNPQPIPGYLTVQQFEGIVKFFATNSYKSQSWTDYQKTFKAEWTATDAGPVTPPPGH